MIHTTTGSALTNSLDSNLAEGDIAGRSVIHKFGRNGSVGTTFAPVTDGGVWQTPLSSSASTLRIKAGGDANDTAAGTGAREITLQGVDETGALVSEAVATAGASASAATTTTFMRLFRAYVSESGTYASATDGSHADTITIEDGAGSEDWGSILLDGFALGQSTIACYTVPLGYTALIEAADINVQSNKTAEIILFQRQNILETSAPFSAMRVLEEWGGVSSDIQVTFTTPILLPGLCDVGFMAKAATTAEVDCGFTIELIKDGF